MSGPVRVPLVLLAGNPNSGKTTLFNALTGARARTGNYPGVTVERRVGTLSVGGRPVDLVDLPGTYSLSARSEEERVAAQAILPSSGPGPDAVVVVCDATALERHLYLAEQIRETGVPVVVALNMMDEAEAEGLQLEVAALASAFGAPMVPVVARRGRGTTELLEALARVLEEEPKAVVPLPLDAAVAADVEEVALSVDAAWPAGGVSEARRPAVRWARALWTLLSVGDDELRDVPAAVRDTVEAVQRRATSQGRALDQAIIMARYERLDAITGAFVRVESPRSGPSTTERIDRVLTHPAAGSLAFVLVMGTLFQALFSWSEPLVAVIEAAVGGVQGLVRWALPDGPLQDLLTDGVVAGVGNVIVFVPQIAMLSLFIALLEDSGYLARVAFVIDRVMRGVGLHGRAFVPLLSGFACAVPAVLATRTIENRKDRLVTMLALPLMSCSARLPVYTLVIGVAFPSGQSLPGGLSVGAGALLLMYAISVAATLGAAGVLRRTVLPGPRPALVLELPPYRWPLVRNLALATWERTRTFVTDAGTLILAITIVLWAMLTYPKDAATEARYETLRAQADATLAGEPLQVEHARLDAEQAAARMEHSLGGRVGRAIEPVVAPLGFDWKIGVGLVASFAAREVLVSTLAVVYGVGADQDEESDSLRSRLRTARRADGRRLFTPLVGLSLMVFFVLAAQCMSTLAIVRRESGGWRWPLVMLVYMNVLAYVASLLVYQGGLLLGFE